MRRKVGEALIEKGLITPAQLEIALRNQLILGGHLGTCLLELGFVEEERLGGEAQRLIEERNEMRRTRRWKEADEIRDRLLGMGIAIKDGPTGTTWKKK